MKCFKCGHEIPKDASFCNQCGEPVSNIDTGSCEKSEIKSKENTANENKKQWNDKYTILILIIIFTVAISGGLLFKRIKSKDDGEEILYSEENFKEEHISNEKLEAIEGSSSIEETIEEEYNINFAKEDVEEEILWIREKYNDIVANISEEKYEEYSLEEGVIAYCDDSELCAVVVSQNVNQNPYRRFYYYYDGKLIFAYYENDDAHRLYFHEEQLIRWRYSKDSTNAQDAVNYDLEQSQEYKSWESCVLDESNMYNEQILSIFSIPFNMSDIVNINASSELSEYNMIYSVERLIDEDLSTAWVEGVAGQGEGQELDFYFDAEYRIQGMIIGAGYQKSNELYNKNSRPSQIKITFSDGTYEVHDLKDVNDYQKIVFDEPRYTEYIILTIDEVYPGTKYEDTVISEISFY